MRPRWTAPNSALTPQTRCRPVPPRDSASNCTACRRRRFNPGLTGLCSVQRISSHRYMCICVSEYPGHRPQRQRRHSADLPHGSSTIARRSTVFRKHFLRNRQSPTSVPDRIWESSKEFDSKVQFPLTQACTVPEATDRVGPLRRVPTSAVRCPA